MAITSLPPVIARKPARSQESKKVGTANLRVVETSVNRKNVDRKAFAIFLISVAVAGLLALLAINTALSQGAFELTKLTAQATSLNDQREAVMKKIAKASSPSVLAFRAQAEGMVPSQSPRFLIVGALGSTDATPVFSKAVR